MSYYWLLFFISNGYCHLHQCGYMSIIAMKSRPHYASIATLSWH